MAFQAGTQIRPELANADYSGFVNAANIRAQAMMNLGEQIGGAIKDYQIKKEEGEQRKIRYQTILPYMQDKFGEEEGKNIANLFAKQPKDFNAVYQFMALEQDTNILKDAFAVSTTPEGNIDYNSVLPSYMALGGGDPKLATEAVQAKMEMDKLGLAQRQETRLEKTSEAEIELAQDRAALAQQELDLKQSIFEAEQGGDTVAAQKARAELDKTKAQTRQIEAQTEEIGREEKDEDALSASEIMKTQQLMEDLDVYYDDEKNKFMVKGGLPGSWGDKELTEGSNAYMQIAATKGGRALLKQASPVSSEAGASGKYRKGERREQDGVVYEYDGTKFNPVN